MDMKLELENALTESIRSGNDVRKRTLRMAISAVRLAEKEQGKPLDTPAVTAILRKEVKSRQETIDESRQAGREDLAAAAESEMAVLESFLPEPLSPEELQALAQAAIAETGAASAAEMGKVMKVIMPRVQGRASGDQVRQTVQQLLQQS